MKKRQKKWCLLLLCILAVSLISATPALAASNKAVRIKTTFPVNDGENDDGQNVLFGAYQKTKCKATKKMKLSCTVYIPVSAMKNKDDFFSIDPMVGLEIGKKYYGTIFGKYRVHFQIENGKPVLYKETDNGLEGKLSASRGTVKKKKGFYVVTLKKLPLCSWAFSWTPDNKIKINTKKKFNLATYIRILRHSDKKWTGSVFVDNLAINASKTLKMTFDKKDYKGVFAYKFVEDKVKASVAVVK